MNILITLCLDTEIITEFLISFALVGKLSTLVSIFFHYFIQQWLRFYLTQIMQFQQCLFHVIISNKRNYIFLKFLNICWCSYHGMIVEVRRQLYMLDVPFYYVSLGDRMKSVRLGGQQLYLLSHLASSSLNSF